MNHKTRRAITIINSNISVHVSFQSKIRVNDEGVRNNVDINIFIIAYSKTHKNIEGEIPVRIQ